MERTIVIIPAAGLGTRMGNGTSTPKPLVPILGRPLLDYVLERAKLVDIAPLVVCSHTIENAVRRLQCTTVPVRYTQQGAALSVLCANGMLKDDAPVLIMDSDVIVDLEVFKIWYDQAIELILPYTAVLMTSVLDNVDSSYSTVSVNDVQPRHNKMYTGTIDKIAEKRIVSNRVICGTYLADSWSTMRRLIAYAIGHSNYTNGELYLAPTFNVGHTAFLDIPQDAFYHVGTPQQKAAFENYVMQS